MGGSSLSASVYSFLAWYFFHKKKDQIQVKIQTIPTAKLLYNKKFKKNILKIFSWQKKQLKSAIFNHNFKLFMVFNNTLYQKWPPLKKNCAIYLSYATLVTYVPILGAEQFQFLYSVVFNSFSSNWFKLVFAHPPNNQKL